MTNAKKLVTFFIPVIIVALLGIIFYQSLQTPTKPFSSALIDKPAPEFSLPAISFATPQQESLNLGLTHEDFVGHVSLVNIFSSWCTPCREEHPLLMTLSQRDDIQIYGINWKDKPGAGDKFLTELGNPYDKIGDDARGQVAIAFAITGAPETFLIDHKGIVRYRHAGPITPSDWINKIEPMVIGLQNKMKS